MKKLFVFVGDSGSGKTTLVTELIKRYPNKFKKVVTCTSRPMRDGEINGIDYHFLPENYFIDNSNLILVKKINHDVSYGTRIMDLFSNTQHLLLTSKLTGVPKLVNLGFRNIAIVRIAISKKLKVERMQQRGDKEGIISERLKLDSLTMDDVDLGEIPIIELNADQTIDKKIKAVLTVC